MASRLGQEQTASPSIIRPTLWMQCWSFMIGSTCFAIGSAPWISGQLGMIAANTTFFVGSWFFTAGAFIQLMLSGSSRVDTPGHTGLRAVWLAAAAQFVGTLLFNDSTGAALHTQVGSAERDHVWVPNAEGSVAFLLSAFFALIPLWRGRVYWMPTSPGWVSTWFNMFGSIAFGVSSIGAFILADGKLLNSSMATAGTFIGAIFFLVTSLVLLPSAHRERQRGQQADTPG